MGPFKIGRVLGRGGMGAVYEGTHEKDRSAVAVKVLQVSLEEDKEVRVRFETEIETLKRLRHPNIVRLSGFGAEQGQLYYVMEFVDGPSLQQELRKKRHFQWHEVAKIGLDICQALRHAHDRGVIHRDIKPANVLLDQEGNVKLSDFGVARFFGSQQITDIHSVIGTLEYMSPEQALANPINSSTDLYSLGCVLFALLTGKPPFPARTLPELLRKHQTADSVSLPSNRHDVPEELEHIVADLLRIRPEDRPRNAFLVIKRLQSLLQTSIGDPATIKVLPETPKQQYEPASYIPRGTEHDSDSVVDLSKETKEESPNGLFKGISEKRSVNVFPANVDSDKPESSPKHTSLTDTVTSLSGHSVPPKENGTVSSAEKAPDRSERNPKVPARFTVVANTDFDPFDERDRVARPMLSLPVVLTSTMLMIIGLTVYYLLQPVPPDRLYARITAALRDGETAAGYSLARLRSAQNDIRQFLADYPHHPSAAQVRVFQDELDLSEHERRLERRMQFSTLRTLSPVERTYIDVLTSSPNDIEQMIDKLQAFIAVFQTIRPSEEPDEFRRTASGPVEICVELARRRLQKLEQEAVVIIAEQREAVQRRLDEAAELNSIDPARAEGIRRGIIELYQHNRWARELVDEAKRQLKTSGTKS